jgi:O-acetylhomoserine (thiol)-lyase
MAMIHHQNTADGNFKASCPADAGFATRCILGGQKVDPSTGSRVMPIYQNTGFNFKDSSDAAAKFALQTFGPIYSRITNPSCDALEAKITSIEGGMATVTTSCGHAAQLLCFSNLMNAGDNFVSTNTLYGGTATQFSRQFKQFGWECRFTAADDYEGMKKAIDDKTKCIYCESLCNPGGVIIDLKKVSEIAHAAGIPLIVDNTSATPYLCRPFEHGADVVVHSLTKFLGGHGNSLGGSITENGTFDWGNGKFPILSEPCDSYHGLKIYDVFGKDGPVAGLFGTQGTKGLAFIVAARVLGLRDMGMCLAPMNAFLISTGMDTLPLRMEKHCSNALAVAEFLEGHPKVAEVTYTQLKSSKMKALQEQYCPLGGGALFTFSLKGGYDAGKKFVDSVEMISLIANLGDVRTLVAHPASMMHSQLKEEDQKKAGAGPDVIRLSVGIEDPKDIINDMKQALDKVPE